MSLYMLAVSCTANLIVFFIRWCFVCFGLVIVVGLLLFFVFFGGGAVCYKNGVLNKSMSSWSLVSQSSLFSLSHTKIK